MNITIDLQPDEQAYVDSEVVRLQLVDPAETAETFIARMTKKLVGKWVSDQRGKTLEVVQADFERLPQADRDTAIAVFRAKVDELKAKTVEEEVAVVAGVRNR